MRLVLLRMPCERCKCQGMLTLGYGGWGGEGAGGV